MMSKIKIKAFLSVAAFMLFNGTVSKAQPTLNEAELLKIRTGLKTCCSDLWIIKKADQGQSPVAYTRDKLYEGYGYIIQSTDKLDNITKKEVELSGRDSRPNPPESKYLTGRIRRPSEEFSTSIKFIFVPVSKAVSIASIKKNFSYEPLSSPNSLPKPNDDLERKNENKTITNLHLIGYSSKYIVFYAGRFPNDISNCIIKKFKLTKTSLPEH